MMQLSALSRTTSISNSFQPSTLSSISTSLVGEASMPRSTISMNSLAIVGDAAAGAAHGEGRADDRGQADVLERGERLRQRLDLMRARRLETDPGHRLAKQLPILGLVDGGGRRADHLDVKSVEHAHFPQRQRAVEGGLAAHRRQQRKPAGTA